MRFVIFPLCVCLLAVTVVAETPPGPDESRTIGRVIPDTDLTDDRGETITTGAFAGAPLIISPIFTRCPHTCTMITSSLRDAIAPIEGLGSTYNVITLSFDPDDTVEDLRAYRERMELPASWKLAIAEEGPLTALLDALEFAVIPTDDGGFAHPNLVAIIDAEQKISGYVHGMDYKEADIRHALTAAWAGESLVEKYKPWILAVAAAAALALVLTIVITGLRRKEPQLV